MNVYQCLKCGKIINNASTPQNSTTCENKSFHHWTKIAEAGTTNYECSKCGLTIQCKSTPSNTTTCEKKSFHSWQKL